MSKRLDSFGGPSSPSPSPVKALNSSPQPGSRAHRQPSSGSQSQHGRSQRLQNQSEIYESNETTYHRKLRSALHEIKGVTTTWNDLVLHDGLKAAKALVDTRTELSNALAVYPPGVSPKIPIVTPRLVVMEEKLRDLDDIPLKLDKCFKKLSNLCDHIEELAIEASRTRGAQWIHEPLWFTWSFDKFAVSIPLLLIPYHRALHKHKELVEVLRPHSTPFEKARTWISLWAAQEELKDDGWTDYWEDICKAEVRGWPDGMLPMG